MLILKTPKPSILSHKPENSCTSQTQQCMDLNQQEKTPKMTDNRYISALGKDIGCSMAEPLHLDLVMVNKRATVAPLAPQQY